MTTTLSNDPGVTARALWLYDRDLCPKLAVALQALNVDDETDIGESPFDEGTMCRADRGR